MKYVYIIFFLHSIIYASSQDIPAAKPFRIPLKDKYIQLIKSCEKTVEGRVKLARLKSRGFAIIGIY